MMGKDGDNSVKENDTKTPHKKTVTIRRGEGKDCKDMQDDRKTGGGNSKILA